MLCSVILHGMTFLSFQTVMLKNEAKLIYFVQFEHEMASYSAPFMLGLKTRQILLVNLLTSCYEVETDIQSPGSLCFLRLWDRARQTRHLKTFILFIYVQYEPTLSLYNLPFLNRS